MWNRACPLCFTNVPRSLVLTRGDDMVCPSCRSPLEVSRASRVLVALCGVIGGYAGTELVAAVSVRGGWALGVLAAVVGYGIASATVLYFLSDLVVQPKSPAGHFPQTHK
jgi:LSD1 subclass zinc finger protein